MRRIVARSGAVPGAFLWGLTLRVLERCTELGPYLLAYLWLCHAAGAPSAPGLAWIAEPRWLAAALLALFVLQGVLALYGQRLCFLGSYRIVGAYRERLLDRVRRLPLGVLRERRIGHLSDLLTDDIQRVESIFTHVSADFVAALGVSAAAILVLAGIDTRLALALAATGPLALLVLAASRRWFERAGLRKHARYRETAGLLVEFIGGLATLRLFHRTADWVARLDGAFADLRRLSLGIEKWGGGPVMAYRLTLETGLVVLFLAGGWLAAPMETAPLGWLAFFLLAYKFIGPLLEAAEYLVMLRHACQSELKLEEIWQTGLLPEPARGAVPDGVAVCFERVSFAYGEQPVLREISFALPEGGVTAIVGPSGAGKSTILHLLARFHDPGAGAVRIGGRDLREIGSARLHDLLSMVFQDVQLFDGSILENIRAGREQASDAEVFAASRAADCHGFIEGLPDGYRTRVGEGGLSLSGGERQRISIACALLKNAPLLLLDEVTAAVDPASQFAIQTALGRLAARRTVIMVAHRLSTVRNADRILVLRDGEVVESGTHAQLLEQGGLYARMWHAQDATEAARG
ncbi:ABC transporter ATP-binding protein [Pseudothauera nasutitermitis]|uniref:ABC transporter ATP-binding protein n=2 Tax=Pseudothauera nasutitermitis TaxID=2565930 RepID=A0A4S4ASP5_9RHOO|nr:ABC transporter ATP-binding protein [Pseudothauera nasutitermitis]